MGSSKSSPSSGAKKSASATTSAPNSTSTPKVKSTPKPGSVSKNMRPSKKLAKKSPPQGSSTADATSAASKSTTTPKAKAKTTPKSSPKSKPKAKSKTGTGANDATFTKEISDAIASLAFQYQVPVTISQDQDDQKIVKQVMEIYLSDGQNWDMTTKIAFVKALSLIKTSPSTVTIPSNHAIWRTSKEGWNWAYWVVFRAIYGKATLISRSRITEAIQTMFPNTDIWSANTPAAMVLNEPASTAPDASPKVHASVERKRPHHQTLVAGDGKLGQSLAPRSKRARLSAVAQSQRILSPPESSNDAGGSDEQSPPQELVFQYPNSPVSERGANEATGQSIIIDTVPRIVGFGLKKDHVAHSRQVPDTTAVTVAIANSDTAASTQDSLQGTDDTAVAMVLLEADILAFKAESVADSEESANVAAKAITLPEVDILVKEEDIVADRQIQISDIDDIADTADTADIVDTILDTNGTTQEAVVNVVDFHQSTSTDSVVIVDSRPLNTAKITEMPTTLGQADRDDILQQLKQELSAQIQESEQRTQNRIQEFLTSSLATASVDSDHTGHVLANLLDIKLRILALEEAEQARMSNATLFNIPPVASGDNVHSALEALSQQVHKCTRDIYQLSTGLQYEEDPKLSCIKREPML